MARPRHSQPDRRPHRARRWIGDARLGVLLAAWLLTPTAPASAQQPVDFQRDVWPILARHCVKCHGPAQQRGDLRLDSAAFAAMGGHSHLPILGEPDRNELLRRVTATDPMERMPRKADPLSDADQATLRRWVQAGSIWPIDPDELSAGAGLMSSQSVSGPWFDIYITPRWPQLLAVLCAILVLERLRRRRTDGRLRRFARAVPRLTGPLAALAVVLVQSIMLNGQAGSTIRILSDEVKRRPYGLSVASIFGDPPQPFRPDQPPGLDRIYYRGNCERNPQLFNNGNYRTATLYLRLLDADGHTLAAGDPAPTQPVRIHIEIERAPFTSEALFSPPLMASIFLTAQPLSSTPPAPSDPPTVWLDVIEPGQRWSADYPLPKLAADSGDLYGLVYVYEGGKRDQTRIDGKYHLAIRYDLHVRDGRIAPESDLWMSSIYWTSQIQVPPIPGAIPFEQWFDYRPIPLITHEQHVPDKLLGVPEHQGAIDRPAPPAPPAPPAHP